MVLERRYIGDGMGTAAAAFEGAPEEYDITVFDSTDSEAAAISNAAAELVAKVLPCS